MKTVRLGKTNLQVSRIGIGGIPITRPTENEAVKVIQRALDLGVNFIDTAVSYAGGVSEKRIGKAIAGRRDQVIIATKTGRLNKASAMEDLELSLKQLNTDHINLWQLGNISNFEKYEKVLSPGGAIEAAQEALEAGKIRHIGISSHNLDVALKGVSSGLFETILFPFNFISNEAADKLVSLAREHDIGFIAMKTFAGGRLNDADVAIKFLLQFENVVPIPGIEKVEEIEEIVDIINRPWEITPQEREKMEAIHAELDSKFCRQCESCMPCPHGVLIHSLMYIPILYELWTREWFLSWRYVTDAVESGRNCDGCGKCEEKCPYHLPIQEMITDNIKFYKSVAQGKSVI